MILFAVVTELNEGVRNMFWFISYFILCCLNFILVKCYCSLSTNANDFSDYIMVSIFPGVNIVTFCALVINILFVK